MISAKPKFRLHAKHPRVTQELRLRIVTGRYRLGEQLAHRDELELELGASRATVQTALNTLLGEGFLRSAAGRGTYVAERPPFLTDYGFVFPCSESDFPQHRFYSVITGSAHAASAQREAVPRFYYDMHQPRGVYFENAVDDCLAHRVAGLVFASSPFTLINTPLLDHPGIPRVYMQSAPSPYFAGPIVYPDLPAFYRLAMRRLAAMGRRRVAVLTCNASLDLPQQLAAEAENAGLSCWPGHVQAIPAEWAPTAPQLLRLMLKGVRVGDHDAPDALIISDDNLVDDATAGLRSMGLRCPEELAVLALANLPQPPTMHVPCELLAFDSLTLVRACLDSLDMQRRGEVPPAATLIQPVFAP
jgi:DNA-binding LacI/PurR family transcriptional regulator